MLALLVLFAPHAAARNWQLGIDSVGCDAAGAMTLATRIRYLGPKAPVESPVVRLASEYGVETRLDLLPYRLARWAVEGAGGLRGEDFDFGVLVVEDKWRRPVLLFKSEWHLEKVRREHPDLRLSAAAPAAAA